MSRQASLLDSLSAISSPALEDGPSQLDWLDGLTTANYGLAPARVSHSAQPDPEEVKKTPATYGQPLHDSSTPIAPPSFLESKSPPRLSEDEGLRRICKECGNEKHISEFSLTGWKKTYRSLCKVCRNKAACSLHQMRKGSIATRASKLVAAAKSRAATKGLPFGLTVEWVQLALDAGVCEATGIAFDLEANRGWNTPSLDQIQAGKGYTPGNTRVVLFGLNAACGTWGENKVIEMSRAIMARRRERSNELQERLTEILKRKTAELGSPLYNLTWKEWITPSGVRRSRLVASVPNKSVIEFTGWPTPRATDGSKNIRTLEGALREVARKGSPQDLCQAALLSGGLASTTNDARLNPELSRWLMRFPACWSSCAPTEMPSMSMPRACSSKQ